MFNKRYETWVKERDLIAIEIKESNNINRTIYKNIDLIIDFCNRIPELYINSSLDNKRIMLRMLIEEILYNHIDTTLEVKLKPIFEALRRIKESYDENVRTLKTLIIPNKKGAEAPNSKNGAGDGSLLELFSEKLLPIVTAPIFLLLNNDIENYFKMQGNM